MRKKAEIAFKLLNGIVCVYKPPNTSPTYSIMKLKRILCQELNNMEVRPCHPYIEVDRTGSEVSIHVRPSYADHVLCCGPRYQPNNFPISDISPLPFMSSGVYAVCVNGGIKMVPVLQSLNFTKCFHVKGVFGEVHTDYKVNEKVIARATYNHVEKYHMERVLASYQASAQKRIIEEYGLDLQSQEAYEFAVKGLHRPMKKGATILYALKVVDFNPPDFTIEVQCIYETEVYLQNLIHNLGLNLKTFAACTGIRCIRFGCFHVDHTLVFQECNYESILENMRLCWKVLNESQGGVVKFENTVGKKDSVEEKVKEVKSESQEVSA